MLADTEPLHHACWAEVLAAAGLELDWDTYAAHCIGVSDRAMLEFLAGRANPPADPAELWKLYPRKKELFRARVAAAPLFTPELREALRRCCRELPLGVVSSSARAEVEPMLVEGGIRGCFRVVVCGEDVTRHKPAPDPYLLAARQLGVRSALVLEDSEAGLAAARAAGFDAIRVASPGCVPGLLQNLGA